MAFLRAITASNALRLVVLAAFCTAGVLGSCGDCWCAPGNGACPSWQPQTYCDAVIAQLSAEQPVNPFTLSCNPYEDEGCTTSPPQELVDSPTAVCARVYTGTACKEYKMQTFASEAEARAAGAVITHERACGLCSTTQDISIYMKYMDMTKQGKICAIKAKISESWGVKCFEDLGYTHGCAKIWTYDALFDAKNCAWICIKQIFSAFNGPPPFCPINDCLQCDETKAGPIFQAFAGATRRRAGLLSAIVRPCDTVARIEHRPCTQSTTETE